MNTSVEKPVYVNLGPGDPAPWFHQRSTSAPRYAFDTAAGRYIVLCFFGSSTHTAGQAALGAVKANRHHFDDRRACFFGVSVDPRDQSEERVLESMPGIRFFWDHDGEVSRLYGALPKGSGPATGEVRLGPFWIVLDPTLRVLRVLPFSADGSDCEEIFRYLDSLPAPDRFAGFEVSAPILILPNVFEPAFCDHLISLYEKHGGEESGFMRQVNGKTVLMHDQAHKRRRDYLIEDQALIDQTRARIRRRVAPEILKVHQFNVTRMERYIVSCYAAEEQGHFRAHRDNTTKGTAHRRFAVSINLNDDFGGGALSLPEYGPRGYKMPKGGAVVFSCTLLHAVSPVTRGRRYAFLPFLYDDDAAKLREANSQFLADQTAAYKST